MSSTSSLHPSLKLCQLSNHELLQNTKTLVQRECQLFSEILHHLQEIQRRRLYCDLGYRSLWEHCMKALRYSDSQVKRVTDAMKLVQEIPEVESIIARGELSLSNVVAAQVHFRAETKVGVVLSSDKKLEVLASIKNKSAREREKVLLGLVSIMPPEVKESIRQDPSRKTPAKTQKNEMLKKSPPTAVGQSPNDKFKASKRKYISVKTKRQVWQKSEGK